MSTYSEIIKNAILHFNSVQSALKSKGASYTTGSNVYDNSSKTLITDSTVVPTAQLGPIIEDQLMLIPTANYTVSRDATTLSNIDILNYATLTIPTATISAAGSTVKPTLSGSYNSSTGVYTVSSNSTSTNMTISVTNKGWISSGTTGKVTLSAATPHTISKAKHGEIKNSSNTVTGYGITTAGYSPTETFLEVPTISQKSGAVYNTKGSISALAYINSLEDSTADSPFLSEVPETGDYYKITSTPVKNGSTAGSWSTNKAGYIPASTSGSISVSGTETPFNMYMKKGTISKSSITYGGSTVVSAGYYPEDITISDTTSAGTIKSGSATISSVSVAYNSSSSNYKVTGSATVAAPSVSTAGYVSSTVGTKQTNTATLNSTIAKGAISGSVVSNGSETFSVAPGIVSLAKTTIEASSTYTNITSSVGSPTTTTPTTAGYYIALKPSAAAGTATTKTITSTFKGVVSTEGYVDKTNVTDSAHNITGTAVVNAAAKSGSNYFVQIPAASVTSGGTYTPGWAPNLGKAVGPSSITKTATSSISGTTVTFTATGVSTAPTITSGFITSGQASGTATIKLSATEANLIASNIRQGVTIFGVSGSYLAPSFDDNIEGNTGSELRYVSVTSDTSHGETAHLHSYHMVEGAVAYIDNKPVYGAMKDYTIADSATNDYGATGAGLTVPTKTPTLSGTTLTANFNFAADEADSNVRNGGFVNANSKVSLTVPTEGKTSQTISSKDFSFKPSTGKLLTEVSGSVKTGSISGTAGANIVTNTDTSPANTEAAKIYGTQAAAGSNYVTVEANGVGGTLTVTPGWIESASVGSSTSNAKAYIKASNAISTTSDTQTYTNSTVKDTYMLGGISVKARDGSLSLSASGSVTGNTTSPANKGNAIVYSSNKLSGTAEAANYVKVNFTGSASATLGTAGWISSAPSSKSSSTISGYLKASAAISTTSTTQTYTNNNVKDTYMLGGISVKARDAVTTLNGVTLSGSTAITATSTSPTADKGAAKINNDLTSGYVTIAATGSANATAPSLSVTTSGWISSTVSGSAINGTAITGSSAKIAAAVNPKYGSSVGTGSITSTTYSYDSTNKTVTTTLGTKTITSTATISDTAKDKYIVGGFSKGTQGTATLPADSTGATVDTYVENLYKALMGVDYTIISADA